jgi:hypothetical protein
MSLKRLRPAAGCPVTPATCHGAHAVPKPNRSKPTWRKLRHSPADRAVFYEQEKNVLVSIKRFGRYEILEK